MSDYQMASEEQAKNILRATAARLPDTVRFILAKQGVTAIPSMMGPTPMPVEAKPMDLPDLSDLSDPVPIAIALAERVRTTPFTVTPIDACGPGQLRFVVVVSAIATFMGRVRVWVGTAYDARPAPPLPEPPPPPEPTPDAPGTLVIPAVKTCS